jgi:hypothetical protein
MRGSSSRNCGTPSATREHKTERGTVEGRWTGAEGPRRAADRGRPSSMPGRWTGRAAPWDTPTLATLPGGARQGPGTVGPGTVGPGGLSLHTPRPGGPSRRGQPRTFRRQSQLLQHRSHPSRLLHGCQPPAPPSPLTQVQTSRAFLRPTPQPGLLRSRRPLLLYLRLRRLRRWAKPLVASALPTLGGAPPPLPVSWCKATSGAMAPGPIPPCHVRHDSSGIHHGSHARRRHGGLGLSMNCATAAATCMDSLTCCIEAHLGAPEACGLATAEAATLMAAGVAATGTHSSTEEWDDSHNAHLPEWKRRCIRNHGNCQEGLFVGPCYDCLRRCEGQQDWPLNIVPSR